jgi:cell pole-organizing protein PopZ
VVLEKSFEEEESVESVLAAIKKALIEQAFDAEKNEKTVCACDENRTENQNAFLKKKASCTSCTSKNEQKKPVAAENGDKNSRVFELTPVMRIDLTAEKENADKVSVSALVKEKTADLSSGSDRGADADVSSGSDRGADADVSSGVSFSGKKPDLGSLLFELIRPSLQKWLEERYFPPEK